MGGQLVAAPFILSQGVLQWQLPKPAALLGPGQTLLGQRLFAPSGNVQCSWTGTMQQQQQDSSRSSLRSQRVASEEVGCSCRCSCRPARARLVWCSEVCNASIDYMLATLGSAARVESPAGWLLHSSQWCAMLPVHVSVCLQGLIDWLPMKNVKLLVAQVRTPEGESAVHSCCCCRTPCWPHC